MSVQKLVQGEDIKCAAICAWDLPPISLRDYFAGQALAGLMVGCSGMLAERPSAHAKGACNFVMAERSYVLADAMLAAREVKP